MQLSNPSIADIGCCTSHYWLQFSYCYSVDCNPVTTLNKSSGESKLSSLFQNDVKHLNVESVDAKDRICMFTLLSKT